MTVPGVSGGTMAILLGIYERLIGAINGLVPKRAGKGANHTKDGEWQSYCSVAGRSILFLLVFLAGAGGGMFAFAKVISGLLEQPVAGSYVRFFFLGAVAGGIPLILASARVKRFSVWCVVLPVIGAALVYSLNFLPEEMFSLAETIGAGAFLLKLAGGVLLAIALVLPGVSASQMLYTLGIYEEMMACIGELRLLPLVPIGIGTAVGIVLVTKTLETLMTKYPKQTFLIIFGFILGSIPELYPQTVEGNSLLCGLCVAVGFLLAYMVGKRERGKEEA
jgi:putative membrane protein